MALSSYVFQRCDVLCDFYLTDLWTRILADLLRQCPHPRVNPIAWNLWRLIRAQDAGLNRFVTDGVQILDDDGWMAAMNLAWRHNGFGMTFVDQRIDLQGLRGYFQALQARTRSLLAQLDGEKLAIVIEMIR